MPILKLDLTHNLCPNQTWAELPFDDQATLQQVRSKICRHVGSQEESVKLFLCPDGKTPETQLADLQKCLQDYSVKDRAVIHVVDEDPNSILKEINDTENVPRFRLSDEEYAMKKGTAKEFLAKLRAEKPELFRKSQPEDKQANNTTVDQATLEKATSEYMNKRCQLKDTSVRGTVSWIGVVSEALRFAHALPEKEIIAGIKLDDAVGNFDGRDENGKILFECPMPTGGVLVPLARVVVGDFAPLAESSKDEI